MVAAYRLCLFLLILCLASLAYAADDTKTFSVADGSIEMTVGSNWTQEAAGPILEIKDISGSKFILCSVSLKSDVASDLKGFAQTEGTRFFRVVSPTTAPELNEIEINGHKAFQWKVHFIDSDKIHCTATVTCLATQRYLVELQDCTYESKFAASLTELRGILATIRESTTDRAQSGGSQKQPEPNSASGDNTTEVFCASDDSLEITAGSAWKVYSANCQGTTLHISDPLEL